MSLLMAGEAFRHTGATNMNESSSRSHTIFRLIIESSKTHDSLSSRKDGKKSRCLPTIFCVIFFFLKWKTVFFSLLFREVYIIALINAYLFSVCTSVLNLIDLAGSEGGKATEGLSQVNFFSSFFLFTFLLLL